MKYNNMLIPRFDFIPDCKLNGVIFHHKVPNVDQIEGDKPEI